MVVNNENFAAFDPFKALFTEACLRHFDEYPQQVEWQGRTYHLVIGLLEAIPLIGQIVGLIELGIISFYAEKPDPYGEFKIPELLLGQAKTPSVTPVIKRRPSTDRMELPSPLTCRPPAQPHFAFPDAKCLEILGLTRRDVDTLEAALRPEEFPESMVFKKKCVEYINAGIISKVVKLPVTIFKSEVVENRPREYIILSKKVAFESRERKIRWAYSLTTGELLIKKRVVGLFEKATIRQLDWLRRKRHMGTNYIWRECKGKNGKDKNQFFEPLRDGTVSILFGTKELQDFNTKKSIIVDLLHDLRDFQEIYFSGKKLADGTEIPTIYAFHQDIKWDNILVVKQGSKWRSELTDFGAGCSVPNILYSTNGGSMSPEYIDLLCKIADTTKDMSKQQRQQYQERQRYLVAFQLKYGQKRDIWAMGMIILSLLVGRVEQLVYPQKNPNEAARILATAPISCITRAIQEKIGTHAQQDIGLLDVTQDAIDVDINSLESEVKLKHSPHDAEIAKFFKVVRDMIRVNPDERKLAKDLLQHLS